MRRRIYWRLKNALRSFKSWLYWVAFKGTGIPKNMKEWVHFSFEPSRFNLLDRYRRKKQKERSQGWMAKSVVHVIFGTEFPEQKKGGEKDENSILSSNV